MPLRLSGLIFIAACVLFTASGLISGQGAYYGLALMSFSIGVLLIMYKSVKKPAKGKRQHKKGKFQA